MGWLISIHGPKECTGAWQYNVAAGGLLGFFLASFALETAMTIIGLRGSIFETSKRRRLPLLIYLDIVAVTGQIAFNGEQQEFERFSARSGSLPVEMIGDRDAVICMYPPRRLTSSQSPKRCSLLHEAPVHGATPV